MSYITFVNIMSNKNILDVTEMEYTTALEIYKEELDYDNYICFCEWLKISNYYEGV